MKNKAVIFLLVAIIAILGVLFCEKPVDRNNIPENILVETKEEPQAAVVQFPEAETKEVIPEITPQVQSAEKPTETAEVPEDEVYDKVPKCTLSVVCVEVLENIENLKENKKSIIPADGIIFREQEVEFSEGESVFDILLREMKKNGIHLEYVDTPMYNSVYIEGIGNLYEFDCGDYSGWLYSVNGEKPTYGCSQYIVKNGDKIVFSFSCK